MEIEEIKELIKMNMELQKSIFRLNGYEPRCKVCNSPLKSQIEELRLEGKFSYRKISDSLKEVGENISHNSLSRHFRRHIKS